jgi:hypothetical protein
LLFLESAKKWPKTKVQPRNPSKFYQRTLTPLNSKIFPGDVVNRAKYLILDNIGCALGGTQTELGRKYLRVSANWKGIPESTVMGTGTRVSCMNAVYVNTQLANVLDFDDTYDLYSPGHPGNAIIQTAVGLGEAIDASGEELLTAVILGYEVCLRIGRAEGPIDWQWSIYVDSMTRGTTTVSSRLLKLDREEICTAFHHAMELIFPLNREKFDIPASTTVPEAAKFSPVPFPFPFPFKKKSQKELKKNLFISFPISSIAELSFK